MRVLLEGGDSGHGRSPPVVHRWPRPEARRPSIDIRHRLGVQNRRNDAPAFVMLPWDPVSLRWFLVQGAGAGIQQSAGDEVTRANVADFPSVRKAGSHSRMRFGFQPDLEAGQWAGDGSSRSFGSGIRESMDTVVESIPSESPVCGQMWMQTPTTDSENHLRMKDLGPIAHASKGNLHRNPGKRRKSWSAVWTVAPCAKASAAI